MQQLLLQPADATLFASVYGAHIDQQMRLHLTFPEAVPPATPIMKGDLAKVSGSREEFFSGLGGGLKKRTSDW